MSRSIFGLREGGCGTGRTSAALIPGLKALVAHNTRDDAWLNIRPPHMRLSDDAAATLCATFDACGVRLAQAA